MAGKHTAGRMKVVYAFLLLFGPALLLIFISTRGCDHKFDRLDDFGKANDYAFTDALGRSFTQKDFKGKIVLVGNLQQTCPDSCGLSLTSIDLLIYQRLCRGKHKDLIKIITFATDINGNPVDDLSTLKGMLEDKIEGYDPNVWYLASGESRKVFDLTNNDASLLEKGNQYYGGEAFQELLLLLDKDNHLRMVLNGHTEGMIRKMKEHIALLQKEYDKTDAKRKK